VELAKYSQISKIFYEISGHKKVLRLFASVPTKDYELIGFNGRFTNLSFTHINKLLIIPF
jgi:hypothetical protein